VLKVAGEKKFSAYFLHVYRQLACDSDGRVRKTIASSFHEILGMLKPNHLKYFRDIFVQLLRDPSVEVKEKLVPNLNAILGHFNITSPNAEEQSVVASK
jgi:hypothetical protein